MRGGGWRRVEQDGGEVGAFRQGREGVEDGELEEADGLGLGGGCGARALALGAVRRRGSHRCGELEGIGIPAAGDAVEASEGNCTEAADGLQLAHVLCRERGAGDGGGDGRHGSRTRSGGGGSQWAWHSPFFAWFGGATFKWMGWDAADVHKTAAGAQAETIGRAWSFSRVLGASRWTLGQLMGRGWGCFRVDEPDPQPTMRCDWAGD